MEGCRKRKGKDVGVCLVCKKKKKEEKGIALLLYVWIT